MIELHSIPSEQIVLSTLMSLEQIADTLVDQVDISDFYAGRHQIIFSHDIPPTNGTPACRAW